jgi:CNP1-like family
MQKRANTQMIKSFPKLWSYIFSVLISLGLTACGGDPMVSGLDPFAPSVFKEGTTTMPLNPPNPDKLQSFYVSPTTIFKFSIDTSSILIGADGVTRYIVVITNPSGEQQAQYEGIRCDSYQWRLYGSYESGAWRPNPLSQWKDIKLHTPNRYQAALAQGALCDFSSQEKSLKTVLKSLNPEKFTGGTQPTNSFGVMGN